MSKGLKLTLATVAVVLMSMSAMAEAPVIGNIPSPVVGGGDGTTPPNEFVYPDAINLNRFVQDDGGVENIVWSYETVGTQIYSINGTDPIDTLTDGDEGKIDPASLDKDLNTVRNSEENPDGSAIAKITVRNENLSPLGGEPYADPTDLVGIIDSETQVVTLYASDGSTFSQKEILVYTTNEEADRLSPGGGIIDVDLDFTDDDHGFSSMAGGSVLASVSVKANGICIEVGEGGNNLGSFTSSYGDSAGGGIDLTENAVYRIRATMNGSQTTVGLVPLWDVIIQNYDNLTGTQGAYSYYADYYFLDKEGGAYAVGPTTGISDVEFFFVPMSAQMAAWNDDATGAFTTENDPKNDAQIIYRMLDADASANYGGELDLGEVCMKTILIERFDIDSDITRGTLAMDPATLTMTEAHYFALGLTDQSDIDWTTVPGQVTMGMKSTFSGVEIISLTPGEDFSGGHDIYGDGNPETLFPIAWEADTIYMVELEVSAPTVGDEDQPVDIMQITVDPPTWENFMVNAVTRGDSTMHNLTMPKNGTPEPYVAFFSSDQVSKSGVDKFKRLRPSFRVLNGDALLYSGQTESDGKFTIHDLTVTRVTFPE